MTRIRKYLLVTSCLCGILLGVGSPAGAGNSEMVEKSVAELEQLNREALRQIPDIPKQGKIAYKAKVKTQKGKQVVTVEEKTITPRAAPPTTTRPAAPVSGEVVEKNIEFKAEKIPLGLRDQ